MRAAPRSAGSPWRPSRRRRTGSSRSRRRRSTALRVAELFFDPFVDQLGLVEAARRGGLSDCVVLVSRERHAYDVGSLKDRSGYFLELILEVGDIVMLPERR